jgi:hypothetical protein
MWNLNLRKAAHVAWSSVLARTKDTTPKSLTWDLKAQSLNATTTKAATFTLPVARALCIVAAFYTWTVRFITTHDFDSGHDSACARVVQGEKE